MCESVFLAVASSPPARAETALCFQPPDGNGGTAQQCQPFPTNPQQSCRLSAFRTFFSSVERFGHGTEIGSTEFAYTALESNLCSMLPFLTSHFSRQLIVLEIAGLLNPASTPLAWRACLCLMVLGLHVVLPFLTAFAYLGELGLGR